MQYRTLGRTGVRVSPLCLGTMMNSSQAHTATRNPATNQIVAGFAAGAVGAVSARTPNAATPLRRQASHRHRIGRNPRILVNKLPRIEVLPFDVVPYCDRVLYPSSYPRRKPSRK